jgi:hypothetical protein
VENLVVVVSSREGGAPMAGVQVVISRDGGEPLSRVTDSAGRVVLEDMPPDSYTARVAVRGFEPCAVRAALAADEAVELRCRLLVAVDMKGAIRVDVTGERPPREVVRRTIERREINRVAGTRGDALRALQNLPGVARPNAIFNFLVVRGSSPFDTQYFIDGTPVPLIYHFGGLSSVVPTEMLERIDFYPGNFSSQYGRATGGIVDVGFRSPSLDGKYHGLAQVDFIDARVMAQGPIPWIDDWYFAAAGRRSWIDALAKPVLEATGSDVTAAPVYYDYQALVEHRSNDGSKFRATFFGTDDSFAIIAEQPPANQPTLSGNFDLNIAFRRLQFLYDKPFDDGSRFRWVMAYGNEALQVAADPFFFITNVNSLSGRVEWSERFTKWLTVNTGLDAQAGLASVTLRLPGRPPAGQPPGTPFTSRPPIDATLERAFSQPAAYVEAEVVPLRALRIVPGVRLDYTGETKDGDVSPRVNARYDLRSEFPRTTLKGGIGLFHQPPQFQQSVGPIANPDLDSSRAVHYGFGLEQELTPQIEYSFEGFLKPLDRRIITIDNAFRNAGSGTAVGGEWLLRYKPDERFFGWIAYTLSRSTRKRPGGDEVLQSQDQTHNMTAIGSYRLGRGWEAGFRFRVGTGRIVTPIVCDFGTDDCDPLRVNSLFFPPTGGYVATPFGEFRSERLPLFHQLDVRIDKTWKMDVWRMSLYLDVQNVYNNRGVEGLSYNYNFTARGAVAGLPIIPSFGLRGEF